MSRFWTCLVIFISLLGSTTFAVEKGKRFDRAIFVLFENTDYRDVIREPFFNELAKRGANLSNFDAEAHPSQPNYIALTAGDTHGVRTNGDVDLSVSHIGDLLDAKGISWKVYAEGYPGNCFLGTEHGHYARKHVPFISYINIQKNPDRCAKIVNADQFEKDIQSNSLPSYVFYVPDNLNNGHDTGIRYADEWYAKKFGPLVNDTNFMKGTILISTFDEAGYFGRNQVYTTIVGQMVAPNSDVTANHNHYSLLKLIQDNWDLGDFGLKDVRAPSIEGIWTN